MSPITLAFPAMLTAILAAGLAAAVAALAGPAHADDGRLAGDRFVSPAVRAMQADDSQNPGMLWVLEGRRRFQAQCSACHTADALRGVAARYPAFDPPSGQPLSLPGRVRACIQRHTHRAPPAWESDELLSLEAALAQGSRGVPLAAPADPRLQPALALGQRLWTQRFGQVGLSCADCHDRLAGKRLGGSTVPQAHPTGYPVYRLEWQGLGSLQRRLRGCMTGVRAEPFEPGSPEFLALELVLKARAAGMAVDAPAVRP